MYVEYLAALLGAVFNHALTGPAGHTAEAQFNLLILVSGHFIRYRRCEEVLLIKMHSDTQSDDCESS